jgi:hypothetical protein
MPIVPRTEEEFSSGLVKVLLYYFADTNKTHIQAEICKARRYLGVFTAEQSGPSRPVSACGGIGHCGGGDVDFVRTERHYLQQKEELQDRNGLFWTTVCIFCGLRNLESSKFLRDLIYIICTIKYEIQTAQPLCSSVLQIYGRPQRREMVRHRLP